MTELTARALLLDMDGTLVNSDAVVDRCWRIWAAEHSIDPAELLPTVHGRQGHETMAAFLPERSMAENVADNQRMLERETTDVEGVVPVAGAPALMAALQGMPHAVVTSATDRLMRTRMAVAGLPLPATLITAESVSAGKPDPQGFLKGAAELGFPPEQCIAFEDSDAGIAAALAAGMRVVGVGPRAGSGPRPPTVHIRTLEQVAVSPAPQTGAIRLVFRD